MCADRTIAPAAANGIRTPARWYGEPWPWLLMAGPGLVIVASMITLWLAVASDDGIVADDYYSRGLAINQVLTRAQHAHELGLAAHAAFGMNARHMRIAVAPADGLPRALRLRLVHPTLALADETIVLQQSAPGIYEGNLTAAATGKRVLMLEDETRTWRLAGETSVYPGATLELVPQ